MHSTERLEALAGEPSARVQSIANLVTNAKSPWAESKAALSPQLDSGIREGTNSFPVSWQGLVPFIRAERSCRQQSMNFISCHI